MPTKAYLLLLASLLGLSACTVTDQAPAQAPHTSSQATSLDSSTYDPAAPSTLTSPDAPPPPDEDGDSMTLHLTANGRTFHIALSDNPTTQVLRQRLPLTLTLTDVNRNEKFIPLNQSLPTDSQRPGQIRPGDRMLYGDNGLGLCYESFTSPYAHTPLGHIDDATGLKEALGTGDVTVSLHMD